MSLNLKVLRVRLDASLTDRAHRGNSAWNRQHAQAAVAFQLKIHDEGTSQ